MDIFSPSQVFADIGKNITAGLAVGIDNPMANEAMLNVLSSLKTDTQAVVPAIGGGGSSGANGGGNTYQVTVQVPAEILRNEPQLQANANQFADEFMKRVRAVSS